MWFSVQTDTILSDTLRARDAACAAARARSGFTGAPDNKNVVQISTPVAAQNRLLEALPAKERERIHALGEVVPLEFGAVLCEPGQTFRYAWFPLEGFISLIGPMTGHQSLEMGLVGNEGVLGATLALGISAVPLRGVVQGQGSAVRIAAPTLKLELAACPALSTLMQCYLYVLMGELAQTAACTGFHAIESRLARWLLMSQDRAAVGQLELTHEFLAGMLGVQRGAVTLAAGTLRKRGLIRYSRGQVQVLDRAGLEAASCECYAATSAAYGKLYR